MKAINDITIYLEYPFAAKDGTYRAMQKVFEFLQIGNSPPCREQTLLHRPYLLSMVSTESHQSPPS